MRTLSQVFSKEIVARTDFLKIITCPPVYYKKHDGTGYGIKSKLTLTEQHY